MMREISVLDNVGAWLWNLQNGIYGIIMSRLAGAFVFIKMRTKQETSMMNRDRPSFISDEINEGE